MMRGKVKGHKPPAHGKPRRRAAEQPPRACTVVAEQFTFENRPLSEDEFYACLADCRRRIAAL